MYIEKILSLDLLTFIYVCYHCTKKIMIFFNEERIEITFFRRPQFCAPENYKNKKVSFL